MTDATDVETYAHIRRLEKYSSDVNPGVGADCVSVDIPTPDVSEKSIAWLGTHCSTGGPASHASAASHFYAPKDVARHQR